MAEIIPFQGLRYNIDKIIDINDVICPPYDIISPEQQDEYYQKSDYNIIRLELGKEYATDDDLENKYSRAAKYLSDWLEKEILVKEERPSFYIYQQQFINSEGKHSTRTGFIGLAKLEDFSKGVVLAHENTLSKPKADRMHLMTACHANTSQVFVLYDDAEKAVPRLLHDYIANHIPDIEIEGIDCIYERLWVISDEVILNNINQLMADKKLYIADGHHRYETALNYREKLKELNLGHTGNEPYNYIMMMMVEMDDAGLVILPTHRTVDNLQGFDKDQFILKASNLFTIRIHAFSGNTIEQRAIEIKEMLKNGKVGSFVFYDGVARSCIYLELKDINIMKDIFPSRNESYRTLDVCILHKLLLEQLLGIGEKQLADQQYLTYTHEISEGLKWVESRERQLAFFMSPTSVKQVRDVSLAGEKMPQKSTFFFPKPLTGFVINKF